MNTFTKVAVIVGASAIGVVAGAYIALAIVLRMMTKNEVSWPAG